MDLLRIGQVSRILEVCQLTIRKWHKEGKLVPAMRLTDNGERLYTAEQVEQFRIERATKKENK